MLDYAKTNDVESQERLGWRGWPLRFDGEQGLTASVFQGDTDRKPGVDITVLP